MDNRRASFVFAGILILSIVIVVGITWINYQYAVQNSDMNKFRPRWQGTRIFLVEGVSPYSDQTTREIERSVYGRSARSNEEPGFFVYPLYSVIFYAPLALFSEFELAFALWLTVLELSLALIIVVSLLFVEWRPSILVIMILFVYTFLWYHALRPVISGNISVLIALIIVGALLAIQSKMDPLAGFLLALASIKPQMVIVLYVFLIVWAISKQRWALIWSLVGSIFFMTAAGSLFFQDWMMDYIRQVISYSEEVFISTPGAIITHWLPGVGKQMGWVITGIMVALLIIEWRACLGKDGRWFVWTSMLTLTASSLIGIYSTLENYIMLYPSMILIISVWYKRWGLMGKWLMYGYLLLSSVGIWWLLLNGVERGIPPDLNALIYFFTPVILLFGLYWIRWWAVNPARMPIEELQRYLG